MASVLLAWVGTKDLDGAESDGSGPIVGALSARRFDHVVLLDDRGTKHVAEYAKWLSKRAHVQATLRTHSLSGPTHYRGIYEAVLKTVAWTRGEFGPRCKLTFHLSPGTPAMAAVWIIVAKTQVEAALIESSKSHGVADVEIPFELSAELIPAAVQRASADLARIAEGQRPEDPKFGDILHRSEVMKVLVRRARQVAVFSEPVFIEGDSGTGKQLLAEAIHGESPRRSGRFVEVNCGAIPHELFESSFFGHKKGSFSGAERDHDGYFVEAHGGTLFLDEVGELPLPQQVKLLRALQQKKVRPVGGKADVPVDVRVISATNRNLLEEVQGRRFREDLYFRLAILVLRLPPLRDRQGDLGFLIDQFLAKLNEDLGGRPGEPRKKLSPKAKNLLLRHSWPGNVRELDATLRRAFVWSSEGSIDEVDVRDALSPGTRPAAEGVLDRPLGGGFQLQTVLDEVAHHYLRRAMDEAHGNKTRAAELVGAASHQTLTNWLSKYKVQS